MKILLISNAWKGGGVGEYAFEMYRHLPNFGIDIEVVTLNKWSEEPKLHKIPKFPRKRIIWPIPYILNQLQKLMRIKYDSIWTMGFPESLGPLLIGESFVLTKHGINTWTEANYFRRKIWDAIINKSKKIIVPSYTLKKKLFKTCKGVSDKIEVIHHGVNHDVFHPDEQARVKLRLRLGYKDNDFVIRYAGRVNKSKGIYELIYAYLVAKKKVEDLKLLIIGTIRDHKIKVWGEELDVKFYGPVPYEKIPGFFNVFDVFTSLSHGEAFGLTLVEAMACGNPVVCTDIPAYKEICNDSVMFVPLKCAKAVSDAWIQLYESESLRKELSIKARKRASAFDWNKTAKYHAKIFRELSGE